MALPLTGPISLGDVNSAYSLPEGTQVSLNDSWVRLLPNIPNGAIGMFDLYGKVIGTFSSSPSGTSSNEGTTVTFSLTANNFNGSQIFYTVTPVSSTIDSTDLSSLSGSVALSGTYASKTGAFTLSLINDNFTEGAETFAVQLRAGSTVGPVVATSATITINDTSRTPDLNFPNAGFESGIDGWSIINSRIRLNGGMIIQGVPTPADPSPTPFKSAGDATTVTTATTYSFNLDTTDKPPNGETQSLRLTNSGTVTPGYGLLYGPAVYSTNTVAALVGDKISFWWRALGTTDAYNVFGYLVDPSQTPTKYITILRATTNTVVSTAWAEASVIITAEQVGNYYFVFVNGAYDATGGRAIGSELKIDMIKRYPAGTY